MSSSINKRHEKMELLKIGREKYLNFSHMKNCCERGCFELGRFEIPLFRRLKGYILITSFGLQVEKGYVTKYFDATVDRYPLKSGYCCAKC